MALPDQREHRVLSMLSLPRTAIELGRQLAADRTKLFDALATPLDLANQIAPILDSLAEQGYVRSLGMFDRADLVVKAIASDDDLVDLPEDKAANYVELQSDAAAYKLREGELWYWTTAGREALLG